MTVTAVGDRAPLCTIHVKDGDVVFVTSTTRAPRPGEGREDYILERVCSLVGLKEAVVGFEPGATRFAHPSPVPIERLLVASACAERDTSRVAVWLGGLDVELVAVNDPFAALRGCSFDPAEGYFLSRIEGRIVPRTVVDEANLPPGHGVRLLCALRFAGALTGGARERGWIGDADLFGTAPAAQPAVDASTGVDMAEVMRICYLVEEKMRAIESGVDDYALLEVERRAPIERIRTSYRELLKTFHPDRHAQLAAFAADVKQRLERIVGELTRAYSTLSNPKEREAYDQKLADRKQVGVTTQSAKPAAPPSNRPAPPPATPEPAPRKPAPRPPVPKPLVAPLPKAPKPPPVEASPEPPPPARPEPSPPLRPPPALDPNALFERGAAYASVGDFERAVRAFSRGVEVAPDDGRMHAALGSALADLQGLDREAELSLRRAAELSPNSAELFVALANVYRRFDRTEEARRLYKRALLIDPDNEDARAALQLGPSSAGGKGFFKRLLKHL